MARCSAVVALLAVASVGAEKAEFVNGPIHSFLNNGGFGQFFNAPVWNATQSYPMPLADESVPSVVSMEQFYAKTYTDLVLKVQYAYFMSTSMKYFDALVMADQIKKAKGGTLPRHFKQAGVDLLAHYNLFYASKVFMAQQVFAASELQQDFFNTRMMQVTMESSPIGQIPEFKQQMYLNMLIVFLKTQQLSVGFRVVSTFTTWLEDELDVSIALIKCKNCAKAQQKAGLMQKDLIETRSYAMSSFYDFASLDITIFGMERYFQYQTSQMMTAMESVVGGAVADSTPAGAASYLETEAQTGAKTEAQTGAKFYAALAAPFFLGGEEGTFLTIYTGYQKYAMFVAAYQGRQSTMFSKMAVKYVGKGSGKKMDMFKKAAKASWAQFSAYTTQSCYIDYGMSMWLMYKLFIMPSMGQAQQ